MATMFSVTDGISALAMLVSVAAFVVSLIRGRYERERSIRGQLNEVLRQSASVQVENAKVANEIGRPPTYYTQMSNAYNQQLSFLTEQARYLAEQIPHLVTSIEYSAIAWFTALANNLVGAEDYYKRGITTAPDTVQRLMAYRTFAAFLYTQRRFEEAREQYRLGFAQYSGSDNFARYHRGLTYQYYGWNELNFANSPRRAEEAFESAESEFRGIDVSALRESALRGLEDAKHAQAAFPPVAVPDTGRRVTDPSQPPPGPPASS